MREFGAVECDTRIDEGSGVMIRYKSARVVSLDLMFRESNHNVP